MAQQSFTMNASREAFQILSSNLYSNPILAIIRELSTNCNDANIESGSENPFKLHVPTTDEQFFDIRDYGPGIPEDLIYNIYTSYFVSTKTADENQTGCFGLGSKTPFALVDSYKVISYCEGMKKTYLMKKVDGLPTVEKIAEEPSNETGLEIYFDIGVSSWDATRWKNEAVEFFKGTSFMPYLNVIDGDSDFDWDSYAEDRTFYSDTNIRLGNRYETLITVNVAGVNFKVPTDELKTYKNTVKDIFDSAGIAEINIMANKNDVTITPSREALHFDDKTITFVYKGIVAATKDYFDNLRNNIDVLNYKQALEIIQKNKFAKDVNTKLIQKIDSLFYNHALTVRPTGHGCAIRTASTCSNPFNGYYSSPKQLYVVDCSGIKQTVKKNVVDNFFGGNCIDGDKITSTSFCNVVKQFVGDESSFVVFIKDYESSAAKELCKEFAGENAHYIKWADYVDIKKESTGIKRGFKIRACRTIKSDGNYSYGYYGSADLKDDEVGLIIPSEEYDGSFVEKWLKVLKALNIDYNVCIRPCIDSVFKKYKEKGFKTPEEYVKEIAAAHKDLIIDDLTAFEKKRVLENIDLYCYSPELEELLKSSEFDELANTNENFKNLRELYTEKTFNDASKANYAYNALNMKGEDVPEISFSDYPMWEVVRLNNEASNWKLFLEYAMMYDSQKKTVKTLAA